MAGELELDRRSAEVAVMQVLGALDERSEVVAPHTAWVCEPGLLVLLGADAMRAGFGVRSGLTRSAAVLREVAQANQVDPFGHLWLAEGRDDHHWALVWGLTLPFAWLSPLALHRALYRAAAASRGESRRGRFDTLGHDYWAPMVAESGDLRAPAQVLWGHLA